MCASHRQAEVTLSGSNFSTLLSKHPGSNKASVPVASDLVGGWVTR